MTGMTASLLIIAAWVIAAAATAGAFGAWGICTVVQKGFNQHIKAMQAIYENTKRPE